ncbi:MAG: type II toxin-antitoxin system RelE/ParE family toxin [Xanthobacteraceae bacterium]|nr:type II toxin-antitoxin system RelE/ParE family toxin [Xanthobacteraceae bacterium]
MATPRRRVIWSADARSDLDSIWDYYERVAGPNAAEKMIRQIDDVVRLIQEHPFAGRGRDEVRACPRSFAATACRVLSHQGRHPRNRSHP